MTGRSDVTDRCDPGRVSWITRVGLPTPFGPGPASDFETRRYIPVSVV
jgi:hypothetical protein